mgnify:CR=1 FL=1
MVFKTVLKKTDRARKNIYYDFTSFGDSSLKISLSERKTLIFLPSPKDTGQLSVLQERASVSSDNPWLLFDLIIVLLETQSFPPHDIDGLLHSRVLVWFPPPQVALQAVKLVHSPQPPLTIEMKIQIYRMIYQKFSILFIPIYYPFSSSIFYGVFNSPKKRNKNQLYSKVKLFLSVFGRIQDTNKTFQN